MRIAIAGAGNVGRSIAQELIGNGHEVMLIEKQPRQLCPERVPRAQWILADACEPDLTPPTSVSADFEHLRWFDLPAVALQS